jgi:multidrug efflux pump subunit AcrA (membrane-fusion protein)
VIPLELHDGSLDFDVDGVVIAYHAIEVPAEVAGRITFRSENCRIGRTVEQGELLLRIDGQDYDLEVSRLEEQFKQAEASIHELEVETRARRRQIKLAEEDLAIKKREVERYERINDPGVYSKSELDAARLKELQARDALQTENDQLELLEAQRERLASASQLVARQLEKAKLDLARTKICSPLRGVITREPIEEGCFVQRGGVVAVIQDTSRMEIKCSLQMRQMHWLWQGSGQGRSPGPAGPIYEFPITPVTVVYEIGNVEYRWKGELGDYAGAQVDRQTRMVPCRVYVRNPCDFKIVKKHEGGPAPAAPPGLMAGMFVTVRVHARPEIRVFRLPESAVQPGGRVWVVRDVVEGNPPRGRLHEVGVQVAYSHGNTVLAYGSAGRLCAGELIVSSPLSFPREATEVELLRRGEPTARDHPQAAAADVGPRQDTSR